MLDDSAVSARLAKLMPLLIDRNGVLYPRKACRNSTVKLHSSRRPYLEKLLYRSYSITSLVPDPEFANVERIIPIKEQLNAHTVNLTAKLEFFLMLC